MSAQIPIILMKRNFFTDEQGNLSMGRLLVFTWSLYLMFMWLFRPGLMTEHEISASLSIMLAGIGWAGGARVMQYLSPGITNAASSIAAKFMKEKTELAKAEDVTTTTDIQELSHTNEKG